MRVLDLFSGIGGIALGLDRAGMETVAFCEQDPHCQQVLAKHWPDVPCFDDVKDLSKKVLDNNGIRDISLIAGGFPCQDISTAGKQRGITGERSGLWKEFFRLIKEVKPRYVLIENVANLRSKGLATVIKDLWSIRYVGEWHIVSARSLGAPHLRERIFIIAWPAPNSNSSKILDTDSSQNRGKEKESGSTGTLRGVDPSNSFSKGLQGHRHKESFQDSPSKESKEFKYRGDEPGRSSGKIPEPSNSNNLRCWKPFASEKEKQKWWSEASSCLSHRWEVESMLCGVDDGLPKGLDKAPRGTEKIRRERIKQLGNAVVPQIPELIGREILNWERKKNELEKRL